MANLMRSDAASACLLPNRRCPNGCGPLRPFVMHGMEIARCAVCAGVYLSPDAVRRLRTLPESAVHSIEEAIRPTDRRAARMARSSASPRPCPVCAALMLPYEVPGRVRSVLDRCAVCDGLWADHHELAAAMAPSDFAEEIHYGAKLSAEARDALTLAFYDSVDHPEPISAIEDTVEELFPTFASWSPSRRQAAQSGVRVRNRSDASTGMKRRAT